jgi:hypothetical protein
MRTRRSLLPILFVCTVACLNCRAAFAQPTPDIPTDPNKVAVPAGLNSAINLSAALLAIDDKSPMAFSVSTGTLPPGLIADLVDFSAEFKQEFLAFKNSLSDPNTVHGLTNAQGLDLLSTINRADVATDKDFRVLFSNPTLLDPGNQAVKDFYSTPGAVKPDTQAVIDFNPLNRGIVVKNRLLLRDFVAYLNKTFHTSFSDPSGFTAQELARELPLDVIATAYHIDIQMRAGGGATVYAPQAIYSNGLGGFDVGVQAYLSELNGYAAAFRLDLSPGRTAMVHAVSSLKSELSRGKQMPALLLTAILENRSEVLVGDEAEAKRLVAQMQLALRSSVQFSYRHIDSVGSFASAGVSVSKLFPITPGSRFNGITFLFGAQALQYAPISGSSSSTIRSGVAVYWQNRVSRLLPGGSGKPVGDIRRWTTQSGVEYNFRNSLQLNDTYGVFLRQRIGNFTEFIVSVGRAANKQGFLGLSFGKTFF